jgi:hypothetical protein
MLTGSFKRGSLTLVVIPYIKLISENFERIRALVISRLPANLTKDFSTKSQKPISFTKQYTYSVPCEYVMEYFRGDFRPAVDRKWLRKRIDPMWMCDLSWKISVGWLWVKIRERKNSLKQRIMGKSKISRLVLEKYHETHGISPLYDRLNRRWKTLNTEEGPHIIFAKALIRPVDYRLLSGVTVDH